MSKQICQIFVDNKTPSVALPAAEGVCLFHFVNSIFFRSLSELNVTALNMNMVC